MPISGTACPTRTDRRRFATTETGCPNLQREARWNGRNQTGGIMAGRLDHELATHRQSDHLCPTHDTWRKQTASAVAFITAELRCGKGCPNVANDSSFEENVLDAGGKTDRFGVISGWQLKR